MNRAGKDFFKYSYHLNDPPSICCRAQLMAKSQGSACIRRRAGYRASAEIIPLSLFRPWAASDGVEGLGQIADQIGFILDADGDADQGIGETNLLAQIARHAGMGHRGGM